MLGDVQFVLGSEAAAQSAFPAACARTDDADDECGREDDRDDNHDADRTS
ncbi:hypothetical protein [Streptomyces malaysiensis]|uniref:Uncharacterized protein n=1 Tax=Streptomyces malaysiensis TaxID=92644 RepID=A0A2J7Z9K8_STRMQ|nr:hypothetical protein [Streptomyces malaysiensis]PNG96968.1 hypothetical protein SMF913_12993 [Streptomyces malaysiensis]